MSESEPGCQQCRHVAAELALDVLPGRERGNTLRHLDGCSRCRDVVHALAGTADQLIELVPEACPPDGFERRVVAALTASARRRRSWPTRTAAMLGGVALIASGWLALPRQGSADPTGAPQPGVLLVHYAPLMSRHQPVGDAYFYSGDPPWIYLSVATPPAAAGTNVSCEAVRQDGATSALGNLPLNHGQAGWTLPTPRDPDPVVAARLVDQSGHTVAMARFAPSPKPAAQPPEQARPNTDHAGQDDHDAHPNDHSDHSSGSDHSAQPSRSHHVDEHSGRGTDNGHGDSEGTGSGNHDPSHNDPSHNDPSHNSPSHQDDHHDAHPNDHSDHSSGSDHSAQPSRSHHVNDHSGRGTDNGHGDSGGTGSGNHDPSHNDPSHNDR